MCRRFILGSDPKERGLERELGRRKATAGCIVELMSKGATGAQSTETPKGPRTRHLQTVHGGKGGESFNHQLL